MSGPEPIISLPTGGGALHGIGESFTSDLHTGTGNFVVPITLPAGRNGFQPQLSLGYSSCTGNGPFGLGLAAEHSGREPQDLERGTALPGRRHLPCSPVRRTWSRSASTLTRSASTLTRRAFGPAPRAGSRG